MSLERRKRKGKRDENETVGKEGVKKRQEKVNIKRR